MCHGSLTQPTSDLLPSTIVAMRVLVCTDSFGGTLSAAEASETIAHQFQQEFNVTCESIGLSDGGPGFLESVQSALRGVVHPVNVTSVLNTLTPASWFESDGVAYIESAEICGLHLVDFKDPLRLTTYGVGEIVRIIIEQGISHIRIGLGGVASNDAGAGMLAALGATSVPADVLRGGGIALRSLQSLDLHEARNLTRTIKIEILTDVENPLLGTRGATRTYAGQKGASIDDIEQLESSLQHFASLVGVDERGKNPAVALGAGAAGGLGFGFLALGAERKSGFSYLATLQNLEEKIQRADLIVTGEGSFDWKTLDGKVISGLAHLAMKHGKPLVVIAGQVALGRRDWQTIGVNATFAMTDDGPLEQCLQSPSEVLSKTASRMGRTWLR